MLDPDFRLRKVVLCPDSLSKWLSRIKLPNVANMNFRRSANPEAEPVEKGGISAIMSSFSKRPLRNESEASPNCLTNLSYMNY